MKLPAVPISRDGVSKRNCAVAKPAFALTSYGAVHLALLSGRSLWRRLIIPVATRPRAIRLRECAVAASAEVQAADVLYPLVPILHANTFEKGSNDGRGWNA